MFNPEKIQEKLERAAIHLIETSPFYNEEPLFKLGFTLQRHSITQVVQANNHLDEVRQDLIGALPRERSSTLRLKCAGSLTNVLCAVVTFCIGPPDMPSSSTGLVN